MEERQPGHSPVGFFALEGLDHLHHIGGQIDVGDLNTGRDTGGSGGVLQVGDGVFEDGIDVFPGGAHLFRHRVDGDDAWAFLGRPRAEELAHTLGGLGGGQNRRGLAVVEHGMQPPDMAGLGRIEQWHRDPTGVQRAEERDEVVQVLRAQDCHPIARCGDLLQTGAHGAIAGAELIPAKFARDTVAFGGEVQEPIRQLVAADAGPALDMLHHARALREGDPSVLDERVMERHTTLLSEHSSVGLHRDAGRGRAVQQPRRRATGCPGSGPEG